jgi:hypothetical protein
MEVGELHCGSPSLLHPIHKFAGHLLSTVRHTIHIWILRSLVLVLLDLVIRVINYAFILGDAHIEVMMKLRLPSRII